ncbi:MAG: hypothetical protein JWP01_2052 [Myxococcales bacterium]|nr:hypothetical protein [Myxococcales bacterium]
MSCVLTKPVSTVLKVTSEGRKSTFDARPLVPALGLKPGQNDAPELGAAIREGVCCLDLRLYGRTGTKQQRVMVHMATGASVVGSKADDRWYDDSTNDMCGDEDLDVTVTRER